MMQNDRSIGISPRPAFHFPPSGIYSADSARYRVMAILRRKQSVLIGHARSYRDAIALTRLVRCEDGISTEIVDVVEEFFARQAKEKEAMRNQSPA